MPFCASYIKNCEILELKKSAFLSPSAKQIIKNVGFITFNNHFTLNMNPFIYLCNKS